MPPFEWARLRLGLVAIEQQLSELTQRVEELQTQRATQVPQEDACQGTLLESGIRELGGQLDAIETIAAAAENLRLSQEAIGSRCTSSKNGSWYPAESQLVNTSLPIEPVTEQIRHLLADRDPSLILRDYLEGTQIGTGQPCYSQRLSPYFSMPSAAPGIISRKSSRMADISPYDRVLLTTLPRSGTNFYIEFFLQLFGLTRLWPDCGSDPSKWPLPPRWDTYEFDDTYLRLDSGELLGEHLILTPKLAAYLAANPNVLSIHAIRDVRDVVVSSTRYILSQPQHALHPMFHSLSFDEALLCNITGCCVPYELQPDSIQQINPRQMPIIYDGHGLLADRSRPWVDQSGVFLRFERFFTEAEDEGSAYLLSALRNRGIQIEDREVEELRARLNFEVFSGGRKRGHAQEGHHYYKGVVGEWRSVYKLVHIATAKVAFGKWLIDFGYETDLNWKVDP